MINLDSFLNFLINRFENKLLFIDKFKPELWFIEVDCFYNKPYKLSIEISLTEIKLSTISKIPKIDFSLYEYSFTENLMAEDFIEKIYNIGAFPFRDI